MWVIFAETRGESGALKMAWRTANEPGADEKEQARAKVTGMYRVIYEEWPESPKVTTRDEKSMARSPFS